MKSQRKLFYKNKETWDLFRPFHLSKHTCISVTSMVKSLCLSYNHFNKNLTLYM